MTHAMQRKISVILMTAMLLLAVSFGMAGAAETEEWSNDNTINVTIKSEYVKQVMSDIEGTFADINPAAVYITQIEDPEVYITPQIDPNPIYMTVLLVLNDNEDAARQAAIAKLTANPAVQRAEKYGYVPFEPTSTLRINPSKATIKVGETVTLTPEGSVNEYLQEFDFESFEVGILNCDPGKEYAPSDFPQYNDIASVRKLSSYYENNITITYFDLKLGTPGYFNMIKAVNAFSLSSDYCSVCPYGIGRLAMMIPPEWKISDDTIADYSNKEEHVTDGDGNVIEYRPVLIKEKNAVDIKGLKPGSVTVSYYPSIGGYYVSSQFASCEITVVADNESATAPSATETIAETIEITVAAGDESATAPSATETIAETMSAAYITSPKTGDESASSALLILMVLSAMTIFLSLLAHDAPPIPRT